MTATTEDRKEASLYISLVMFPEGTLCSRHEWLEAGITPRLSDTKALFLTHTQGPALLGAGRYPGPEGQEGVKAASEKTEVGPRRAQALF